MSNDVLKAGVLEVTVVQAIGVGLQGSGTALARRRRKPAILARVTVDGTTKSGSLAPHSHHPVWFPAPRPGDSNSKSNSSHESHTNNARATVTTSRSIGQIGLDGAGTGFLPRAPEQNPADGAADYDTPGSVGLLERTRGRYGSCLAGEGGLGGGSAKGGGNDVSGSGGGGHGNSSSVARGLLFEVREFYGPCQIQIEMVSGGAGSGGGGLGGGPGGGGMVLGRCEARLSEALVGRGGSAPSATTGLVKGSSAMSASASKDFKSQDNEDTQAPSYSALLRLQEPADSLVREGGELLPSWSVRREPGAVADAGSRIGSDRSELPQTQRTSCFPGGGVFGRWRRRAAGVRHSRPATTADEGEVGIASGNLDQSAPRAERTKVGSRAGVSSSRRFLSARMSWGRGAFFREKSASGKLGKELSRLSTNMSMSSCNQAFSIEEAENLALRDWGRRGSSDSTLSAKDVWKELTPAGEVGKAAGGDVGRGGTGVLSAVRLRLRFVPIWDCLEGAGGRDGLGALHAAARDGDSSMVHSLVSLWKTFSPDAKPLTLKCPSGLTPIQHCIEGGNESALRELLRTRDGRSSLQAGGKEGEDTALHTAIKAGQEGMLRMLLAATKRCETSSPVLTALRIGLGTPPNTLLDSPGADGLSPLSLAAICGSDAMVKCLLEEGADASKTDARGMTALAHAAHVGKIYAVRVLLKAKSVGSSGESRLRRSRLARMACAPCKTNNDGMGPLALAAASGSHQVVSELMRADVPYRTRDREGRTPLHHAAAGGHISVLRVLVAEMRRGKGRSVAGPGGAVGPGAAAGGAGGGEEGVGGGDDVDEKKSVTMRDHSLMMDGGPFKINNLDLAGRSAYTVALLNNHPQAAAFLEAASAELDTRHPRESHSSSKRRPWGGAAAAAGARGSSGQGSGGGKGGQLPRAANASALSTATQGCGSGAWSGSGSETPCRSSPMSSVGMDSAGSIVASEDLSYEYVESDREGEQ